MDLFHLEYFCTVAMTKNISEAARRHYITQPAMSKYMSYIEKELQAPLFIRTGNQIMLSAEGERFYAHAKQIVANYKDALAAINEEKNRLCINFVCNSSRHILIHYLTNFLTEHPNVDFLVDFNNKNEALQSRDPSNMYHFSIGTTSRYNYLNKSAMLFKERQMLAVHKEHRLADKSFVSIKDLVDDFFILQALSKNYSTTIVNCCTENGFTPKVRVMCNETKYLCHMVSSGIGVTMMPEFSWRDMIDDNIRLIPIVELEDQPLEHRLYWADNRYYSKDMVEFREGLIRYYRNIVNPMETM